MKGNENNPAEMLLEAVGIVSGLLYLGLQIYYGLAYDVDAFHMVVNIAALLLVYAGLSLLTVYPEKVNGLTKEACSGRIRSYTIRMVRIVKLIFVVSLLFTSICDVMGHQLNQGYSLIVVVLMAGVTFYYEARIIKIFKNQNKK